MARAAAEDVTQEPFAGAWAGWARQRAEKAVKAWLYAIARHEHARLYERKRLDVDPDADLDALVAREAADPSLSIDLRKAFRLLPQGYRDPLLLQVLGGRSSAELALDTQSTER